MKQLADVNREIEDIQQLVNLREKGLQKLKDKEAHYGLDVPLSLLNEIEMFEQELEKLQLKLAELHREKEFLAAPTVYIANLGAAPPDLPAGTIIVDRSSLFVFDPRQVPLPEVWQAELLPELSALPARTGRTGLVRLQGSCSLSTAFAFGQVFRNVGGYQLAVEQRTPDRTLVWYSNETLPAGEAPAPFVSRTSAVNQEGDDGLIIIYAAPQTSAASVVTEVGAYWGEPDTFKQLASEAAAAFAPRWARGVLVLEAGPASQGLHLTGWQAASLATTSRRKVVDFIQQVEPAKLHLFFAGPVALAAFIGHYWNQIGLDIQCYERLNRNRYVPSLVMQSVTR